MIVDVRISAPATHVAADLAADSCEVRGGCITCGDVAVILTVAAVTTPTDALCRDDDGGQENVALELVGPVHPGDRLLVHAGVALEHLGRAEET